MKTKVIIASAFTVLSLGIITSVFATSNQTEEKTVAKSIETVSTENKEGVTPPVQAEEPVIVEQAPDQVAPTPAPKAPEYFEESQLFGHTISKVIPLIEGTEIQNKAPQITGAITQNYQARKELFTVELIDNTIEKCVAYFKGLTAQEVQLALAKSDCGL